VKFLLIDFRSTPTIGYIEYSSGSDLIFSEQKDLNNIYEVLKSNQEDSCIVIDQFAGDEPFLSVSIKKLLDSKYKITTKDVTNAIKTIDMSGKVTSHLDRDKYNRLSTPIKADTKCLQKYFKNNSTWDLEKYLKLNNLNYKDYETLDAGLILESK